MRGASGSGRPSAPGSAGTGSGSRCHRSAASATPSSGRRPAPGPGAAPEARQPDRVVRVEAERVELNGHAAPGSGPVARVWGPVENAGNVVEQLRPRPSNVRRSTSSRATSGYSSKMRSLPGGTGDDREDDDPEPVHQPGFEQRPAQGQAAEGVHGRHDASAFISRTASTGSRSTSSVFAHARVVPGWRRTPPWAWRSTRTGRPPRQLGEPRHQPVGRRAHQGLVVVLGLAPRASRGTRDLRDPRSRASRPRPHIRLGR